ncbi:MAG: potassium transporter TrkA [Bacteroidetes bacterium]|nr:MAG: potassium transporter TrkA [Bacteroidota bacterium]
MIEYKELLIYFLGFIWILFASAHFSKFFQRIKLPLITGFIATGIITGPHVLNLITSEAVSHLGFVNDVALAFIAFAAGAELFLKEIRSQFKSIIWNTIGQLVVTFILSALAVYYLAELIPFMQDMDIGGKIAISILAATIFIASSPSSAIAVINEMRAKGPFTKTAMGVTVVKDVFVIILFAINFSIASMLFVGDDFEISRHLLLIFELFLAFGLGFVLSKIIELVLSIAINQSVKAILIVFAGYSVFALSHIIRQKSLMQLGFEVHFEPLLAGITGSFLVTNYSRFRPEFHKILHETGPMIYVAFFTLTGAMLSIDLLTKVWFIALILLVVRVLAMIIGVYTGSTLAGDPKLHRRIGWMSYITQAGVGLGLATEVSGEFPTWGPEFATIIISVIVLNQFVGPPLLKWALARVGEAHPKAATPEFDGIRDAIIFGLEDQSIALARQLLSHGWDVKIATTRLENEVETIDDIDIHFIQNRDLEALEALEARKTEAIVLMLSDEENFKLCEIIYENIGTKEIIVRLHDRINFNRFHDLGVIVVEPATAIVSLLDHFVRSPLAASLLLGTEDHQDTIDIEVMDKDLHGVYLRNLRLPSDVIVLGIKRKGQMIISHGYTRLRLRDVVTIVGEEDSLEEIKLRFGA